MAGPESAIEKTVCNYSEKQGMVQRKYKTPGMRNAPDRIFFASFGVVFFIEFKAPKKKPRKGQIREAEKLRALGQDVYFVDNVAEGKKIIDSYT